MLVLRSLDVLKRGRAQGNEVHGWKCIRDRACSLTAPVSIFLNIFWQFLYHCKDISFRVTKWPSIQPLKYFWLSCETLNADKVLFLHSTPLPPSPHPSDNAYVRIMTTGHTPTPVSLGGEGGSRATMACQHYSNISTMYCISCIRKQSYSIFDPVPHVSYWGNAFSAP
jgi:hypothetical protein